jgi:hypothetical protein
MMIPSAWADPEGRIDRAATVRVSKTRARRDMEALLL